LNGNAPPELVRQLLEARLQSDLQSRSSQLISETEIARDWNLLEKAMGDSPTENVSPRAMRSAPRSDSIHGNRP
jgi:hypothetical protein